VTEILLEETDNGEGDSETRITASARIDVVVERERFFPTNERVVIMLLEHKQPGTLRRSDWIQGYYDGSYRLNFNAKIIAEQNRKDVGHRS